nr:hypothetical protein [Tanacetum cinerariifolium]
MEYMDIEEAVNMGRQSTVDTTRPNDDTARPDVSIARQELSTVGPTTPPTTTTIFDDEEMTFADTLIKLKYDKAKGVAFKDSKDTNRPARSILTLKPLSTINPKDKSKGILKEPESKKKMTKSDFDAAQIARDEEIARQLEIKLQAEVERERHREEKASMDYIANLYDEVQERIDDDHELAVRLTHEEQEKYTMVKRAKLLATVSKARTLFDKLVQRADNSSRFKLPSALLDARIKKLEKRCNPSISHHKAWLRSVSLLSKKTKLSKRESVSKQGRKNAKSGLSKDDSAELNVELDEDMEYMDIEEAVNKGRQSTVDTTRPNDDTARPDVSIARQELST